MIYGGYRIKGFRKLPESNGFMCKLYDGSHRVASVTARDEFCPFEYDFSYGDGRSSEGDHQLKFSGKSDIWMSRYNEPSDRMDGVILDLILIEKIRKKAEKFVSDEIWVMLSINRVLPAGHGGRIGYNRIKPYDRGLFKELYDEYFDLENGEEMWEIIAPST